MDFLGQQVKKRSPGLSFFSFLSVVIVFFLLPRLVFAQGVTDSMQHEDPITPVILWATSILFFALLGRYLARRLLLPGVLGELLMGIIIGNLFYFFRVKLIILLREGPSIFLILKDVLAGLSVSAAVSQNVLDPFYASQVLSVLRSYDGIDFMKVAFVLDIFAR